jgi:hypothetical protein
VLPTEEDSATTLFQTESEKSELQDQRLLFNMSKKEEMAQKPHTIVAIAEKESMVSPNWDHITTKDYLKDKKQFQDHTEEFCVLDALNQESSEHFC